MSTFSILQPEFMTTEQLRTHLKMRFPNQNVSTLSRDELLKLYSTYAVPKARRTTSSDIEMRPVNNNVTCENEHKRRRHQMISAPTVETVTTACKKIRLIGTERSTTMNKRQCESSLMESEGDNLSDHPTQTKRKKITWP